MAADIQTNPDMNQFDGQDYADLTLTGISEAGRTTAGSMDFFIVIALASIVLLLIIGLIVWGYLKNKK